MWTFLNSGKDTNRTNPMFYWCSQVQQPPNESSLYYKLLNNPVPWSISYIELSLMLQYDDRYFCKSIFFLDGAVIRRVAPSKKNMPIVHVHAWHSNYLIAGHVVVVCGGTVLLHSA